MGENTAIEWCEHTFNPVWGCVKVSPACNNCYAAAFDHRLGGEHWGPHAPLREFGDKHWAEPLKWNAAAERDGVRRRVFCASMADVFDNRWPEHIRPRLWALIRATPHLDWLLLTKRPQQIAKMLPPDWGDGYPNVWLGTTVENQEEADRRIPHLLGVPAVIRFLSCEPLLGPVDLTWHGVSDDVDDDRISWIIAGGESGHGARPAHPDWFRALRDQCAAAGVPFLFKQWGEWAPHRPIAGGDLGGDVRAGRVRIVHPTGQSDVEVSMSTGGHNTIPGSRYMARVGKKAAGRHLDGVLHDAFPMVRP